MYSQDRVNSPIQHFPPFFFHLNNKRIIPFATGEFKVILPIEIIFLKRVPKIGLTKKLFKGEPINEIINSGRYLLSIKRSSEWKVLCVKLGSYLQLTLNLVSRVTRWVAVSPIRITPSLWTKAYPRLPADKFTQIIKMSSDLSVVFERNVKCVQLMKPSAKTFKILISQKASYTCTIKVIFKCKHGFIWKKKVFFKYLKKMFPSLNTSYSTLCQFINVK